MRAQSELATAAADFTFFSRVSLLSRLLIFGGVRCTLLPNDSLHAQRAGAALQPFDPVAIVELGGAVSRDSRSGTSTADPSLATEITPIEYVLEHEGTALPGETALQTDRS